MPEMRETRIGEGGELRGVLTYGREDELAGTRTGLGCRRGGTSNL